MLPPEHHFTGVHGAPAPFGQLNHALRWLVVTGRAHSLVQWLMLRVATTLVILLEGALALNTWTNSSTNAAIRGNLAT